MIKIIAPKVSAKTTMAYTRSDIIRIMEQAALAAGLAILEVYREGTEVLLKADCSPVTKADQLAETIILERLGRAFPDIAVIAEESVAAGKIPNIENDCFFLVDPLDGTKEFIARNGDFTVNIALIEGGVPITGIVYAPEGQVAYSTSDTGVEKLRISPEFTIADRQPITVRPCPSDRVALISRSHNSQETLNYLEREGITERRIVGSSLKFGLIAEGEADIYPRFSRTMEWDTAAGDAILRAAGGHVTDVQGAPLVYGKPGFENPSFIAFGGCSSVQKPEGHA